MNFPFKDFLSSQNKSATLSYRALRTLIGVLGMALPLILLAWGGLVNHLAPQQSISIYYYSPLRDFFVGLMVTVSLFLITYKGRRVADFLMSTLAGLGGLTLAFFPCKGKDPDLLAGLVNWPARDTDPWHLVGAGVFFGALALTSFFLFTRIEEPVPSRRKLFRNWIYRICGAGMILAMAAIFILYRVADHQWIAQMKLTFILEAVMLGLFGLSWLVKGGVLWGDKKPLKGPR